MKTTYLRMQWLAPAVGVLVVGGGLMAAKPYFELQREVRAHEAFTQTVERLYQDHKLSLTLKLIHAGDVAAAARQLDGLLCQNIVRLNEELASADAETQRFVEEAWRRIALERPGTAGGQAAGSSQANTDDRTAAESILRKAVGSAQTAQVR